MSIKTRDNHVLFFGRMSIKTSDKQSLEGCGYIDKGLLWKDVYKDKGLY